MKRTTSQLLKVVFGLVAFFALIGYVGSYERAEEVIYNMSQEAYDAILHKLGEDNSKDIAREYMSHKEFYDSL